MKSIVCLVLECLVAYIGIFAWRFEPLYNVALRWLEATSPRRFSSIVAIVLEVIILIIQWILM